MTDQNNDPSGEERGSEDPSVRLARDLATSPPPKSLDTVTAASEAAETVDAKGGKEEREHRIRVRSYELWEQDGRPESRQSDFWLQAEAEIAREDAGS